MRDGISNERLDEKLNSFIVSQDKHNESQEKHNDTVVKAITKMSDTISNLNTVHTEIAHLTEKITSTDSDIALIKKDLKDINDKVIVNSIHSDEFKNLKKVTLGFVLVAILSGGYVTKVSSDSSDRSNEIMKELVKTIKDKKD